MYIIHQLDSTAQVENDKKNSNRYQTKHVLGKLHRPDADSAPVHGLKKCSL